MLNILEQIKDYLEGAELHNLTLEQKKWLRNRFNTSITFEYGATQDDDMILKMNKNYFGNMEYYYGFEYEREDILLKIEFEDDIIVVYCNNDNRVTRLFEYLMPDEFCEE